VRNVDCVREEELVEALQSGRWPETADPVLRQHVEGCASCADLLAVAAPLLDEHHALAREAQVPSSAIVWWRAQMRSKREAAQTAAQPITVVQGITFACIAGLLATALGFFVPTFRSAIGRVADAAGSWSTLPLPAVSLASPVVLAAIAAIGLCAIVLPVALYFTLHED
jgi:hypothetical protein